MNRKGFLLAEETLKIIIAVIAIGFLVYFLVSLYLSSQNSKEFEQAEATLSFLITEIEAEHTSIDVYNPTGWSVMSWPFNEEKPLACSNLGWESCICVCKNPLVKSSNNYLQNCDKSSKGICEANIENLVVSCAEGQQCPIKIDDPPLTLEIDYENKIIEESG